MAHLLRLIRALLVFVLAAGALGSAIGQTPVMEYRVSSPWVSTWYSAWGTKKSACDELGAVGGAQQGGYPGETSGVVNSSGGGCDVRIPSGDTLGTGYFESREAPGGSCLLGMVPGPDGKCMCKDGTHDVGGACVANDGEKQAEKFCAGMASGKHGWKQVGQSSGSVPSQSCYMPDPPFDGADAAKGCVTSLGDSVAVPNADGTRSWSAYGVATGATCTDPPKVSDGTANSTGRAAENPCPKGYPGTVNGAAVCVPVSSTSGVDSTVKTSTTNANGTRAEVTEETKCTGGTCVTTTTTNNYNTSGGLTGTTRVSTTEPIGAKCAKTPANKVCTETGTGTGNGSGSGSGSGSGNGDGGGGDSSFGGNCVQGFKAVSEDAVINAMAEETFRQNCKVNPDDASQKEGKAAYEKGETPSDMTKDNPNNSEVSVGPANFDQSNAIGGGGCIADKTVTVAGKAVTLPLSSVCQYLEVLGGVLLACSFLLAARIVTRG